MGIHAVAEARKILVPSSAIIACAIFLASVVAAALSFCTAPTMLNLPPKGCLHLQVKCAAQAGAMRGPAQV